MAGSILVNGFYTSAFSSIWIWHLKNTKTWNQLGIIYHMLIDDCDWGHVNPLPPKGGQGGGGGQNDPKKIYLFFGV